MIRKSVESVDGIILDKGIDVFAQEFNSSSVDFKVRWWTGSTNRDGHESRDKVICTIKQGLDNAGIKIPFPHVTPTFKGAVPLDK